MSKPKSGIDWDNAGGCPFTRLSVFGATQMAQRKRRNGENNRTLTLTLSLTLSLTLNLTLNDFRRYAVCVAPNTDRPFTLTTDSINSNVLNIMFYVVIELYCALCYV